jgi:hypothetical protein
MQFLSKKHFTVFLYFTALLCCLAIFSSFSAMYQISSSGENNFIRNENAISQNIVANGSLDLTTFGIPKNEMVLTQTGRYPLLIHHSLYILNLPFYINATYLQSDSGFLGHFRIEECRLENSDIAQILSNYFYIILFIIFSLKTLRLLDFDNSASYFSISTAFLATPMVWILLFNPSNFELASSLLNLIVIYLLIKIKQEYLPSKALIAGIFLGVSFLISTDALPYLPLALILLAKNKNQRKAISTILFLFGFLLPISIDLINFYQSWGEVVNVISKNLESYFDFSGHRFNFINTLTSRYGLIFNSPVYLIIFFTPIAFLKNKNIENSNEFIKNLFLKFSFILLILSILRTNSVFSAGYPHRTFIPHSFLLVYTLALFFRHTYSKFKITFITLTTLFFFINLASLIIYFLYKSPTWLEKNFFSWHTVGLLFDWIRLYFKSGDDQFSRIFKSFIIWVPFLATIFFISRTRWIKHSFVFAIYFIITLTTVATLNILENKSKPSSYASQTIPVELTTTNINEISFNALWIREIIEGQKGFSIINGVVSPVISRINDCKSEKPWKWEGLPEIFK